MSLNITVYINGYMHHNWIWLFSDHVHFLLTTFLTRLSTLQVSCLLDLNCLLHAAPYLMCCHHLHLSSLVTHETVMIPRFRGFFFFQHLHTCSCRFALTLVFQTLVSLTHTTNKLCIRATRILGSVIDLIEIHPNSWSFWLTFLFFPLLLCSFCFVLLL